MIAGGYEKECHGLEDPSINPNWDIIDLFEESMKFECFIIDAHTDSNKGILNTTQKGQYRANCFKSDQLSAVCYKSEEQKDKLENTIKTSDIYRRNIPLSFVKFSDAHLCSDVGSNLTWIKMEEVNFSQLKSAFSNPTENISVEEPKVNEILNKLLQSNDSHGVSDFSDKNKTKIAQLICGLNNSEGGYVLIGVTKNKTKRGIELNTQEGGEKSNQRIIEVEPLLDLIQQFSVNLKML